jgi:hypothetical protein
MIVPPKIIRDYIVCVGIVGLGCAFIPLDAHLPFSIARTVAWFAILGVGVTTFRWAAIRGMPARDRNGRVLVGNVLRSLAMTGVMAFAVVVASTPFFVIVGELTQR